MRAGPELLRGDQRGEGIGGRGQGVTSRGLGAVSDEELASLAAAGSEEAAEELLRRYEPLARGRARSFFLPGADWEDLYQEGLIGIFKAFRDFRPEKGVSFRAFADLCVTRQVLTAVRAAARRKHAPLNFSVSLDGGYPLEAEGRRLSESTPSLSPDPADVVIGVEEVRAVKALVQKALSELEAAVLSMYVEGRSYQQIAAELRIRTKSIDNALQRAKRKIESFLQARQAVGV